MSEILLAVIAVIAVADKNRSRVPVALGVTILAWLVGTWLSDQSALSPSSNSLRGVVRILVLLANLAALVFLVKGEPRRVLYLWAGIAASLLLSVAFFPTLYARGEPWKFGLAIPATLIVLVYLSSRPLPRQIQVVVILALSILHFSLGSRSLAIICVVTALVLFLASANRDTRSARVKLVLVVILGAAAAVAVASTFDRLALDGSLGVTAQNKAYYQSDGQFGSLFSGRTGVVVGLQSIADNPFLGGGSYSTASQSIADSTSELYRSLGYVDTATSIAGAAPSYHSELIGSVAENGVLALPFWLATFFLLIRGVISVLSSKVVHGPLVAFISLLGIWDVVFSPFGADRRFWLAATLVSILALTPSLKRNRNET